MYAIIATPNINTFFDDIGAWSNGYFGNFLPVALWILGIIVGGILVASLIKAILNGASHLFEHDEEEYKGK